MIQLDRKVLTRVGWIAGFFLLWWGLPTGCMTYNKWQANQALAKVFGPPNSGNLESPLAHGAMTLGAIKELEKMTGGKTRISLIQKTSSYGDPLGPYYFMNVVLTDGARRYSVNLAEAHGQIWGSHEIPKE
jgi:hypothetical protein